jgi:hypothetical protein
MRTCKCGADISHRHASTKMCLDCSRKQNLEAGMKSKRKRHPEYKPVHGMGIWKAILGKTYDNSEEDCMADESDYSFVLPSKKGIAR